MSKERFAGDRIQSRLRPSNFTGRLIGGQVILLPFSVEAAIKTGTHNRIALQNHDEERDGPLVGLTAIYTGMLQRSVGRVGRLDVMATYHRKFGVAGATADKSKFFGYLNRSVGKTDKHEMEKRMAAQDVASIERGQYLAAPSVRYVILGGLPGGGWPNSTHGHK